MIFISPQWYRSNWTMYDWSWTRQRRRTPLCRRNWTVWTVSWSVSEEALTSCWKVPPPSSGKRTTPSRLRCLIPTKTWVSWISKPAHCFFDLIHCALNILNIIFFKLKAADEIGNMFYATSWQKLRKFSIMYRPATETLVFIGKNAMTTPSRLITGVSLTFYFCICQLADIKRLNEDLVRTHELDRRAIEELSATISVS